MLKEIFDRTLAVTGLIAMFPFILLIGLLIKIESSGPIFFKHLRVGKSGKNFWMYKFRKMSQNIKGGPEISPKHDHRLTKVGRVLERLKLDEIPQLINIAKGEMSFVGPRPEIPQIVKLYTSEQRKVLRAKPGLVGPNQIIWRNEKNLIPENVNDIESYYIEHILPQKLTMDIQYTEEANFFQDLKYFFLALGATIFEPFKPVHFFYRRQAIAKLLIDVALCMLAFFAALVIKYDQHVNVYLVPLISLTLPLFCFWQIISFIFLEVYKQVWQYFSKSDLIVIIKAISFATVFTTVSHYLFSIPSFSLLALNAILCTGFLSGFRFLVNYLKCNSKGIKQITPKNILVYGANQEGELFLRRVLSNLVPAVKPVGFLDYDAEKRGLKIHDIEVMGNAHDLPALKSLHNIEEIYIAVNENVNEDLETLIKFCQELQIEYNFISIIYSSEILNTSNEFDATNANLNSVKSKSKII